MNVSWKKSERDRAVVNDFMGKSFIGDDVTLRGLLEKRAERDPDHVFCYSDGSELTIGKLEKSVNQLANALIELGLKPSHRVAVMMDHHTDHIVVFFALAKLGVTNVPINVHHKGESLRFLLDDAKLHAVIADARFYDRLEPLIGHGPVKLEIWRGRLIKNHSVRSFDFAEIMTKASDAKPPYVPAAKDLLTILYTSGTTGMPKGVLLTDRMLRAAGLGCILLADMRPLDVLFFWDPIYHIFGSEVLVLTLICPVTLALVERFSASHFWDQCRRFGATHIHYVGSVLPILLKQPVLDNDRDHPVRIAWGGGCTAEIQRRFEDRFHVEIREGYGLTETSSFCTINTEHMVGSVGKALPYFDISILNELERNLGPNQTGEIVVREKEGGVLFSGYFQKPEATAAVLREGCFFTGDLGFKDDDGFFYFKGRKKDCVRHRGENVSAWEVERVVNEHPQVAESALIGIPSDVGEDELKIFIMPQPGHPPEPMGIIQWCENRLSYFQIPRYIAFVDSFPKTPTQRIRKELLPKSRKDCWDLEAAGYRISHK